MRGPLPRLTKSRSEELPSSANRNLMNEQGRITSTDNLVGQYRTTTESEEETDCSIFSSDWLRA